MAGKKRVDELEADLGTETQEGVDEPSGALAPDVPESVSVVFETEDGQRYRRVHERVGGGWKDYCVPAE